MFEQFFTPWVLALEIVIVLGWLYLYLNKVYSYWSDRGVPGPKTIPLVGQVIFRFTATSPEKELSWARQYGPVFGTYEGLQPTLTVGDPELIRQILVRDFDCFRNRRIPPTSHEILDRSVFNVEDADWKRIRTLVTPAFTTAKLRAMRKLMSGCVDKLDVYFDRITQNGRSETFNLRKVISGFTIDVIASTAFATETNANDDRIEPNAFVENGTKLFDLSWKAGLCILLPRWLVRWLGIRTPFDETLIDFFISLCRRIVQERKARPNESRKRCDLVQMLIDASVAENELKNRDYGSLEALDVNECQSSESPITPNKETGLCLSEDEVVAQCQFFFLAGFETTAATLSCAIYELALNPGVQEKLSNELSNKLDGLDRSSLEYYDKVMNLPYLEGVIKETLRKYPPIGFLERRVSVDSYDLDGIKLERDTLVQIMPGAIHYNEKFYPDPSLFKPNRWLPEKKHLLTPYTFLPFGGGPKNCVGMRFAYQEIKLCLAHLVPRYRFILSQHTAKNLELSIGFILQVKNIPLCVERRTSLQS